MEARGWDSPGPPDWRRHARTVRPREPELDVSERAELQRLRKEIQQVKMERDFLKEAAAFFASQNQ